MQRPTAILDACVLYPAPLRSFLMYIAATGVFAARWTDAIHDEWMRNVLKDFPDMSRGQVERIRDLMNIHVADCLVADYETLISTLELPDPGDRHVLAAAIRCGAQVIVTANLRNFPGRSLKPFGIEAKHPDEFILQLLTLSPGDVCVAAKNQRLSLKNPAKTVEEYLAALERQSLVRTVRALGAFADRL